MNFVEMNESLVCPVLVSHLGTCKAHIKGLSESCQKKQQPTPYNDKCASTHLPDKQNYKVVLLAE